MHSKVIFGLLLLAVVAISAFPSVEKAKQIDVITEIGEIGGKFYYIGETELSWQEAKFGCDTNSLELATAETLEEIIFLNETLISLNSEVSHYWVSARERFVWQPTGQFVGDIGEIDLSMEICLSIRVPDYETLWKALPCSDRWPMLCQSKSV